MIPSFIVGDIDDVVALVFHSYVNGETPLLPAVPAVSVVCAPVHTWSFPVIVASYEGVTLKLTFISLADSQPRLSTTVTFTL